MTGMNDINVELKKNTIHTTPPPLLILRGTCWGSIDDIKLSSHIALIHLRSNTLKYL